MNVQGYETFNHIFSSDRTIELKVISPTEQHFTIGSMWSSIKP